MMGDNNELVERVARAMCSYEANKDGIWFDDGALQKHIFNNWRSFNGQARAAIAALQSTTPDRPVDDPVVDALREFAACRARFALNALPKQEAPQSDGDSDA